MNYYVLGRGVNFSNNKKSEVPEYLRSERELGFVTCEPDTTSSTFRGNDRIDLKE